MAMNQMDVVDTLCDDPANPNYHLQFIPEEYHPQIVCHYISKHLFDDEKIQPECVICTRTGYLFEFQKKHIVGCLKISSNNVQKIQPLLLYEDKIKVLYVLELIDNVLEIVSRSPHLKTAQLEKDVYQWKIEAKFGVPHLLVKNQNEIWRTISFTEDKESFSSDGLQEMSIPLKHALQNMKWRLQKCQALLTEKRQFRARTVASFSSENYSTAIPVCLLECHYALHHGNIVIVAKVLNTDRHPVSDIHLVVAGQHSVKLQQRGQSSLANGAKTLILGFMTCDNPTNDISVAVSFVSSGSRHFIPLPPHGITVHNILSDEFKLVKLEIDELCEALLHCSQEVHVLQLKCAEELQSLTWELLLSNLKNELMTCVKKSPCNGSSVWTSINNSELSSSYVVLNTVKYTVGICCRDSAQFGILCLALHSNLPAESKLIPYDEDTGTLKSTATSSVEALRHELDWIMKHSKFGLGPVPAEQYQAFYQELLNRSCVTDACFNKST